MHSVVLLAQLRDASGSGKHLGAYAVAVADRAFEIVKPVIAVSCIMIQLREAFIERGTESVSDKKVEETVVPRTRRLITHLRKNSGTISPSIIGDIAKKFKSISTAVRCHLLGKQEGRISFFGPARWSQPPDHPEQARAYC